MLYIECSACLPTLGSIKKFLSTCVDPSIGEKDDSKVGDSSYGAVSVIVTCSSRDDWHCDMHTHSPHLVKGILKSLQNPYSARALDLGMTQHAT